MGLFMSSTSIKNLLINYVDQKRDIHIYSFEVYHSGNIPVNFADVYVNSGVYFYNIFSFAWISSASRMKHHLKTYITMVILEDNGAMLLEEGSTVVFQQSKLTFQKLKPNCPSQCASEPSDSHVFWMAIRQRYFEDLIIRYASCLPNALFLWSIIIVWGLVLKLFPSPPPFLFRCFHLRHSKLFPIITDINAYYKTFWRNYSTYLHPLIEHDPQILI